MKRALITGASSYLGNKLAQKLHGAGIDVHLLIRPQTDVTRLPADIPSTQHRMYDGSTESLVEIVKALVPDVIYHIAGLYRREPVPAEVDPMLAANFGLGIQILEALRQIDAPARIVNAGTYAQFYAGGEPRPLNLYALTKQAFQDALEFYADSEGFLSTTLILFDSYGPDDWRPKLLDALVRSVREGAPLPLPDEDVTVDLIHINDVVAAFVRAGELLLSDPAAVNGQTFSVSSGYRLRLSEVVRLFERVAGVTVKTLPDSYALPARRIVVPWDGPVLPGWRTENRLEDGIREVLAARGISHSAQST